MAAKTNENGKIIPPVTIYDLCFPIWVVKKAKVEFDLPSVSL